jgi:hypothetical protein
MGELAKFVRMDVQLRVEPLPSIREALVSIPTITK